MIIVPSFVPLLGRPFVMAACFKNGDIHLVRSYDDVIPQVSLTFPRFSECAYKV